MQSLMVWKGFSEERERDACAGSVCVCVGVCGVCVGVGVGGSPYG